MGSEVVVVLPRGVEVPVGDDGAPTKVPESEREEWDPDENGVQSSNQGVKKSNILRVELKKRRIKFCFGVRPYHAIYTPGLVWESELAILKVIGIVAEIDVAVVDDAAGVGRSAT